MIKFEIFKNNGEIDVNLNGNYSISQIDISLKDICIELKKLSTNKYNFISKDNGFLTIEVLKRDKEFTELERVYSEMKVIPFNSVIIKSEGFSFSEIQETLQNILSQLPNNFTSRFMYKVDFIKLTIM